MFHVMLYSQWKWTRLIVALGSIAAFALPIVSVQGAARADASPLQAGELLQAVQSWGTLYPVLAAALGLLVAIATWAPDHRGTARARVVAPAAALALCVAAVRRRGGTARRTRHRGVGGCAARHVERHDPGGTAGIPRRAGHPLRARRPRRLRRVLRGLGGDGTHRRDHSRAHRRRHSRADHRPGREYRSRSVRQAASRDSQLARAARDLHGPLDADRCVAGAGRSRSLPLRSGRSRRRTYPGCKPARTVCSASGAAPAPWRTWWTA